MSPVKIKICGLKRKRDIQMCQEQGVDILGLVTEYPLPVPWNLSRTAAWPLLELMKPPQQSCIVTGGPPEKVIELAERLRPSMVQLHYQETLEDTIIIAERLKRLNIKVIKTVPPAIEDRLAQFGTADIGSIVKELCETSIYGLLADSRVPANASGNGSKLNIRFCSRIISLSSKPVIIAGGINGDNVRELVTLTGAEFVDVMTGVETIPGEKDATLLTHLLSSIRKL